MTANWSAVVVRFAKLAIRQAQQRMRIPEKLIIQSNSIFTQSGYDAHELVQTCALADHISPRSQ